MGITAFASVSLASVIEFHLWRSNAWTLYQTSNLIVLLLRKELFSIPCYNIQTRSETKIVCFEHFDFLTVEWLKNEFSILRIQWRNSLTTPKSRVKLEKFRAETIISTCLCNPTILVQIYDENKLWNNSEFIHRMLKQTTSVLTATTLKYTIGAGITAGAGTRLFLQLLLW